MTDIVERLRDRSLVIQYPERERIANEIERLRGIMATCEWCGPDVGADQPDDAHPLVRRLHEVAAAVAKSNSGQHVSPAVFAEILESVQQADAIIKADQQSAECRHGAAHFVETGRWRCNYCPQEAASPQELRASDQQPAAHYPVEWGPSDARQLTCACGNPDPAHADQQSARQGLDELTRMAQEDGLYDGPADKT
jgi:hypothetical protein